MAGAGGGRPPPPPPPASGDQIEQSPFAQLATPPVRVYGDGGDVHLVAKLPRAGIGEDGRSGAGRDAARLTTQ